MDTPGQSRRGLSPRLRGNRYTVPSAAITRGSIPALAGEPALQCAGLLLLGVYPRACGGTTPNRRVGLCPIGLSPRLRGNLPTAARISLCLRSIPALAGEPAPHPCILRQSQVYPRACGGTSRKQPEPWQRRGLSPRLRGNAISGTTPVTGRGLSPRLRGNRAKPCRRK